MKIFHNINLFGFPIGFKNNDDNKFNTFASSLISLCIIVITFIFSIIFGTELWDRSTPISNISKEIIPKNDTIIYLRDLPFRLYFENSNLQPVEDIPSYFEIDLLEFVVTPELEFLPPNVHHDVLRKFNQSDLKPEYKDIDGLYQEDENLYNIDFKNLYVKDAYSRPDSISINLQISTCDINKHLCKNYFSEFSTLKIYLDIFEVYIDPLMYLNHVTRTYSQYIFEMGYSSLKKTKISLLNNIVLTDIGSLFEDIQKKEYISIEKDSSEMVIKQSQDDRRVLELEFISPSLVNKTLIKYIKLQELASRIGGIFNFLTILGHILIYHYNKFYLNVYIFDQFQNIFKKNDFVNFKENLIQKSNNFEKIKSMKHSEEISKNKLIQLKSDLKKESNLELENALKFPKYMDDDVIKHIDINKNKFLTLKQNLPIIDQNNENIICNNISNKSFKLEDAKALKKEIITEIDIKIKAAEEIAKINKIIHNENNLKKIIRNEESTFTVSYSTYLFYQVFCCNDYNNFRNMIVDQILSFDFYINKSGREILDKL